MTHFIIRFNVAARILAIGVGAAALWVLSCSHTVDKSNGHPTEQVSQPRVESLSADQKAESAEQKAVRLAEAFITQNGYTDLPADKANVTREPVEFSANVDELLKLRHDSLERKAFGVMHAGKLSAPGWTIIFRPRHPQSKEDEAWGRAVVMDDNFRNLHVEHKSIFLNGSWAKRL